ncbi:RNA-directed DNA polymerase, eukaryota [Tanacetum coccineum]|uniref:RNA-directed DNA polymerase, eukaryota n=1 Tax=Tanacetum coccineum TaxID=301880 RepID=A0ABQ5E9P5_9ASTR
MESLHLSFSRAIDAAIFTGIKLDSSLTISHLFYADDAVFIGEWSNDNLKVGIPDNLVSAAAYSLGCLVMKSSFKYSGVRVGGIMSLVKAWDETVTKLRKRLSKWKLKTLSIGGRSKSVLKPNGGRSLVEISSITVVFDAHPSLWGSIINEMNSLKGFFGCKLVSTFVSLPRLGWAYGGGLNTKFWKDVWIKETQLQHLFPRLFALESAKDSSVAEKLQADLSSSFRRVVRGGAESQQLEHLLTLLESVILSNSEDRRVFCDLLNGGDGMFLDRLPTRSNLARRNVAIISVSCPICDEAPEDMAHLFFNCFLLTRGSNRDCVCGDVGFGE